MFGPGLMGGSRRRETVADDLGQRRIGGTSEETNSGSYLSESKLEIWMPNMNIARFCILISCSHGPHVLRYDSGTETGRVQVNESPAV